MNVDPKIKYKADTGNKACIIIEAFSLTRTIDTVPFMDMNKQEIIDYLDYDGRHNAKNGIFIDLLPKKYQNNDQIIIYDPEYVKWLENKRNK